MSRHSRIRVLLVVVAVVVGGLVWLASIEQRRVADTGRANEETAQRLLTGMLDQETGLRGFLLTGRDDFLEPFVAGRRNELRSQRALRPLMSRRSVAGPLREAEHLSELWYATAQASIERRRETGAPPPFADLHDRKGVMDAFRARQAQVEQAVNGVRRADARTAATWAAGAGLLIALVIGLLGEQLLGRTERVARRREEADARYRASQAEFTETMQVVESEHEAHQLLKRHLERAVPESSVVVLNRNNSADRLEPVTRVDDPCLAERLAEATPRSCLAIRLGRAHDRGPGEEPLLACELCGKAPGAATCKPLVVGSEVIGSVLVTHHAQLGETDRVRLRDSIGTAAPVLANMRNLAIAEARAATDALTGLPNRRAVEDTLKRMVAQASRSIQPLSALMLDLDHFKAINDRFGHDRGDDALAAVGALLRETLRDSDFAGRLGGEEFVVLAPGTDGAGAEVLAEGLRTAVGRLDVPGLDGPMTVSVGVATFPEVAPDGATLLRMADRALYAAKERGRNRVEVAHGPRADATAR